jgi:hypothetical protein
MTEIPDTVELTPEGIAAYLDEAITYWRSCRDHPGATFDDVHTARCYVDAFQSVRTSLLGELLP